MTDTTNTSANTARSEKPKGIQFVAEIELRDYFAAKAMEAFIQATANNDVYAPDAALSAVARMSYMMADAMLEARKK